MVLLCGRWHVRVNSLWLWWYCGLIAVGQGYLMYRAVLQCKEYNELPWGTKEKPVTELYVYICLIVVSIMCVPFYTLTAVFKVGNYANDGVRLGRDDLDAGRVAEDERAGAGAGESSATGAGESRLQILWKHFVPVCNAFHVLAAFTLLLPSVLLDAQKIKHDLLAPGAIWRSELDVILQNEDSKMASLKRTNIYLIRANLSGKPSPAPPSGIGDNYPAMPISPEFVNYVLALIIYSLRYPAVFWYTKKIFSMIFAAQLFVGVLFYMFSFCSMSVLYKYQVNSYLYPDVVLVVPHSILIILYLLTNAFVFFSSVAIFNYGYYHYNESYRKFLHRKRRPRRSAAAPPTGCQGYVPHTIATITLVLFIACRAAVVYDAVTLYRKAASRTMLASVVWDVCYMLLWIVMWFIFTIKQSWNFRVRVMLFAETPSEIYTIRNDHVRDSGVFANGHVPGESRDETDDVAAVGTDGDADGAAAAVLEQVGTPPSSPTSALRKSGERRVNNARVTFEENEAINDDVNLSREVPRRRSKDSKGSPSKRRKRKQERSEKDQTKPGGNNNNNLAQVDSENAEQPKNIFGDFPLQETPENTLTRSYRHSIRDKCGQYYRHSREFQSPPAAQSSPVLGQKQADLHAKSQPPNKEVPIQRRSLPQSADQKHPDRHAAPHRPPIGQRHSNVTKAPPTGAERVLPPSLPPAHAYSKPKQKHANRAAPSHSIDAFPRPSNPPGMVKNNLGAPAVAAAMNSGGGRARGADVTPNRDIRILGATGGGSGKPEMGRRDSALPSSNETSSNDSSDNVLCSQV